MNKEKKAKEDEKLISKLQNQEKAIKELVQKVRDFESIKEDKDQFAEKLGRLYGIGLIDMDGNPIVKNDDKSEHEEEIRF